jgi:hypothetical protein
LETENDQNKRAAIVFELTPEWHIYWENPGDIGMSTSVEGIDTLIYPTPQMIPLSYDRVTYGYEGRSVFFGLNPKEEIEIRWLACRAETCIPGKKKIQVIEHMNVDVDKKLKEDWKDRPIPCSFTISHEDDYISTFPRENNSWVVGFSGTSLDIYEIKANNHQHRIVWKKRPAEGRLLWVQNKKSCILSL